MTKYRESKASLTTKTYNKEDIELKTGKKIKTEGGAS